MKSLRALETELENLIEAVRRAILRGDPEVAARAALTASEVLERRGPFDLGMSLLSEALGASTDERLSLGLELRCSQLAVQGGRMNEARASLESALARARKLDSLEDEGRVLGVLGSVHLQQSRLDQALTHYEAALAIHREVGNRRFEGIVLGNLGILYSRQGRMEEGRVVQPGQANQGAAAAES